MANKIVNIKSFLQVDSLTRAEQLLTKDYAGAQISMTADEVDPRPTHQKPAVPEDEIIFAHGTYMIALNPGYNKYSNPDDPAYDPTRDTPDTDPMIYEAKLDKSLLPLDPEYYGGCNEKYYFQAMKGAGVVKFGHNWVNDGSALIVDGDNCTLSFACHWEAVENTDTTHQDFVSWPAEPEYDPSDSAYEATHDYTTATWDGTCWGRIDDLYDRNVIVELPLPIVADQDKVIFAHTNSVMSIAEKLVLSTDAVKYTYGDKIYVKTGETAAPAVPNEGVNWAKAADSTFTVELVFDETTPIVNQEVFIDKINSVEPTQGILIVPDEALEVTTLISNAAFQKQLLSE